ncbi:MAG: ROK family protein [Rikenellaceae bacterium]|jgi:glucokinase|nr:ROK family protein [Rikenellaceae bacterium]
MEIGVDLGGTNMRAGLVHKGEIVRKSTAATPADQPEQVITDLLMRQVAALMTPEVTGIGVGVPSVVDVEHGIVYNVANIPSWKEVHLKAAIEAEFGVPAAVNNDCNCFALGEHRYGKGKGCRDVVGVAMGTGVGAGLILGGQLYAGANIGAGEIGGLPYLDQDYEYYCSSRFFNGHGITGEEAFRQAVDGNAGALELWRDLGRHTGNLLCTVMLAYDPQMIILGGSISNGFHLFSESMYAAMQAFPYPETLRRIRIALSEKECIALLGASALLG